MRGERRVRTTSTTGSWSAFPEQYGSREPAIVAVRGERAGLDSDDFPTDPSFDGSAYGAELPKCLPAGVTPLLTSSDERTATLTRFPGLCTPDGLRIVDKMVTARVHA